MSDPKLVLLDLSALTIGTEVIESALLANGINVVRMEVGGHSVYPTGPMAWVDLYVPEEQLTEALGFLEKIAREENDPKDDHLPGADDSANTASDAQG